MGVQYYGEEKLEHIDYKLRKGAYAIIINSKNEIATVRSSRGNTLPGGALEKDEDFHQALSRELLEEIGYNITIKELIGTFGQYILASKQKAYYNLIGNFYICELNDLVTSETEKDLKLEWIKEKDILKKLNLVYQSHAVKTALNNRIELLEKYTCTFTSEDIYENIHSYFKIHNKFEIYEHMLEVAAELDKLSEKLNLDMEKCKIGVYLHDIGRVVDNSELVRFCEENNHKFTDGEREVPSILHQFASRIIAQKVFGINDTEILDAIECHTTLRANPTDIDMIVFLSDKFSWREEEHKNLIDKMRDELEVSKEKAVCHYQSELYEKRDLLTCYHKWSNESHKYFLERL